ncbi:MAG: hypothetical protein RJB66_2230 [Pseudomonadota bacterium]|jgi:hypothetical protein
MKKLLAALLFSSLFSPVAHGAYFTAYLQGTKQSHSAPTHIIVAGVGMELGMSLQWAAVSKAKRYKDLYPNHQVFLIAHREDTVNDNPVNNFNKLPAWGFRLEKSFDKLFTQKGLIDQMAQFSQIASIDLFTHNSPHYGAQLESKYYRMTPESSENNRLVGHFMDDAYAILHGCNTGFIVAPALSKTWGIPVAGTLASTGFEYLHKDGQFYFSGDGRGRAGRNDVSFSEPINCENGACSRMKPANFTYDGIWGNFEGGGLNFFKFFCVKNNSSSCYRTMAKSLISSLSIKVIGERPSLEEYKEILFDFLCTSSSGGKFRSMCRQNLERYHVSKVVGKNGFQGRQVQCSFKECFAKVECFSFNGQLVHHTCSVKNNWNGQVDTLEREYEAYLKGYDLL